MSATRHGAGLLPNLENSERFHHDVGQATRIFTLASGPGRGCHKKFTFLNRANAVGLWLQ
jgi:hypothetical protein